MEDICLKLVVMLPIDCDMRAALLSLLSERQEGATVYVYEIASVAKRLDWTVERLLAVLFRAQAEGWIGHVEFDGESLTFEMTAPD